MTEMEEFAACTIYHRDGSEVTISCKFGLWSVTGGYNIKIMDEAMHYFRQYKEAGEYASIIGGPTAFEKAAEATSNKAHNKSLNIRQAQTAAPAS